MLSEDTVRMIGRSRRPDTDSGKRLERFQSKETAGWMTCAHRARPEHLASGHRQRWHVRA